MTPEHDTEAPRTIEPCEHMDNWVNGLADGSLKGPARLYTQFHAATCPKCRAALAGLKDVHDRLSDLERAPQTGDSASCTLTPERREALNTGMAGVEQQKPGSASG